MKTLKAKDKAEIQAIAEVMMRMNDRNDANASQDSTYGFLHSAIRALVLNNYGINLDGVDINWGGSETWADDVQAAMNATAQTADSKLSTFIDSHDNCHCYGTEKLIVASLENLTTKSTQQNETL